MPEQPARVPLNLQLWFGDILVADLLDVGPHQGTWFALYRQVVSPGQGQQQRRICDFIAFCEGWHQRLERGEDPDAAEFDRFEDVIRSKSWRVPCPDGSELTTAEGPAFFDGQVSWNHPESAPSREIAAAEVMHRLTGRRF